MDRVLQRTQLHDSQHSPATENRGSVCDASNANFHTLAFLIGRHLAPQPEPANWMSSGLLLLYRGFQFLAWPNNRTEFVLEDGPGVG